MIRLTCTQCKQVLEMDDAFAGGVCRCQFCGTIQTVPNNLKGSAERAAVHGVSAKTGTGTRGNGTGLHDLSDTVDAVSSSGLSRSELKNRGTGSLYAKSERKAPPPPPSRAPLFIGAGAIIVILLGVIVWLLLRGDGTPSTNGPNPNPGPPLTTQPETGTKPPVVTPVQPTPHFMTVPISANKVVYLIDRSDSARATFDAVKAAMFNSIESLGPDREFAVIFWARPGDKDKDMKQWSFPEKGLAKATPQQAESCREKFADIQASLSTDISPAIKAAMGLKPDIIFLVSAKGITLDDGFGRSVESVRSKNQNVRIFTIDLANGEGKKYLEPIATKSKGVYTQMSPFDVKPD